MECRRASQRLVVLHHVTFPVLSMNPLLLSCLVAVRSVCVDRGVLCSALLCAGARPGLALRGGSSIRPPGRRDGTVLLWVVMRRCSAVPNAGEDGVWQKAKAIFGLTPRSIYMMQRAACIHDQFIV